MWTFSCVSISGAEIFKEINHPIQEDKPAVGLCLQVFIFKFFRAGYVEARPFENNPRELYAACFPTRAEFVKPDGPNGWTCYHDLEIGTVDGITLRMELVAPDSIQRKPFPAVVYIHGGGWNHGNKDDQANRIAGIAQRGYIGASIMYRFAPAFSFPAQIEDVKAAGSMSAPPQHNKTQTGKRFVKRLKMRCMDQKKKCQLN